MEVGTSINTILPMLALKDGVKGKDIRDVVKQLFLIDIGTKVVPFMLGRLINNIKNRAQKDKREDPHKEIKLKSASIQIHRLYDKTNENDTFDAIVWRLCQLPQTKHLKLASNGIYVLSNNDIIHIEEDIYVRQLSISFDEKKGVSECSIDIFSYSSDLLALKDYITDLVHKYNIHRNNQLGQTIYYFDEIPTILPRLVDKSINYDVAPKNMNFTMSKLCTNKNLDNVYGKAMEIVRKRVRFFMNNKKWYQEKGVPYTLGILMYGEPGCGKTSLIKALSKDCQRHVFNIKLSECTTVSQINNLFFTERVTTVLDGVNHSYNIPIDKRLIVLEDIDCLSNIVLSRDTPSPTLPNVQSTIPPPRPDFQYQPMDLPGDMMAFNYNDLNGFSSWNEMCAPPPRTTSKKPETKEEDLPLFQHPQKLTLSYLLNVLDGVLETPGRIIIMTSNHPEKLDKALVRPGRIDLKVHFEKCSRYDIKDMINKITSLTPSEQDLERIPDNYWTPAEVTQKIFEHVDDNLESIIRSIEKIENSVG